MREPVRFVNFCVATFIFLKIFLKYQNIFYSNREAHQVVHAFNFKPVATADIEKEEEKPSVLKYEIFSNKNPRKEFKLRLLRLLRLQVELIKNNWEDRRGEISRIDSCKKRNNARKSLQISKIHRFTLQIKSKYRRFFKGSQDLLSVSKYHS